MERICCRTSAAHLLGEKPQQVYSVHFSAREDGRIAIADDFPPQRLGPIWRA
jgi:hypothetical protein